MWSPLGGGILLYDSGEQWHTNSASLHNIGADVLNCQFFYVQCILNGGGTTAFKVTVPLSSSSTEQILLCSANPLRASQSKKILTGFFFAIPLPNNDSTGIMSFNFGTPTSRDTAMVADIIQLTTWYEKVRVEISTSSYFLQFKVYGVKLID